MNAKNNTKNIVLEDLEITPEAATEVMGGRKDSQGTGSSGAGSGIGSKWTAEDFWYWAVTSRW